MDLSVSFAITDTWLCPLHVSIGCILHSSFDLAFLQLKHFNGFSAKNHVKEILANLHICNYFNKKKQPELKTLSLFFNRDLSLKQK